MKFTRNIKDIISKFSLQEDDKEDTKETPKEAPKKPTDDALPEPKERQHWYALRTNTDLEGNTIPLAYRSGETGIYVAKDADNDYVFTKRLIPEFSVFRTEADVRKLEDEVNTYTDGAFSQGTEKPAIEDVTDFVKIKTFKEPPKDVKHTKNDLAVNKRDKDELMYDDSKVIHPNAVVNTTEMKELVHNGIYPELVYHNPKVMLRSEDEDGRHIISLYGISKEQDEDGYNKIAVRDVLPPIRVKGKDGQFFWKRQESPTYLMPGKKVLDIIHNDLNKDVVDNLLRINHEEDDPDSWLENIEKAEAEMRTRFAKWKEQNAKEYNLDAYTEKSLINVYLATAMHTHGYPIKFALRKYGKLKNEQEQEALDTVFKNWYEAYKDNYKLDRFTKEQLEDVFISMLRDHKTIEDALDPLVADIEDDDLTEPEDLGNEEDAENEEKESVLTERGQPGEVTDTSKEWYIKDPNKLRDILTKKGIDTTYLSNPFKVSYTRGTNNYGKVIGKYSRPTSNYVITKVKRPDLFKTADETNPEDYDTFYIKDINQPHSAAIPISTKDLKRVLGAEENEDPTPDMWEKAASWKSQHRAMNKGAGYYQAILPDEVVIGALTAIKNNDQMGVYDGYDLVSMYADSKRLKKADPIVTTALRKHFAGYSILVSPNYDDFKTYKYAKDSETGKPIRPRYKGSVKQGPYKHLMMSFK